ncbi:UPF0158 family protein [Pseudonocardia asaccharolytica]|uniref:Polymerase nucleotidyl transferase domain-containing protein n=1 Tax=Pseudonocardia asaccharolytica DSM 44247 = NBRC 16224 TaxID=1123024 RepID=A0A511D403_9PSEU|nr:UPF0158 family protein [Pseudonocardia asaccharolytica]GEL19387.1 hypothetical protein PA7_32240 [Pseudonocardia asaccharolytica DSM 44247 = NBRC 16224]
MLDPDEVDLAELVDALADRSLEISWWIDPRNGRIRSVLPDVDREGPGDDGWVLITPTQSRESYRDMADFVEGVQHRRAAELLDRALNGRGAFRRFKNTLFEFPELRDRWYRFRDARSRRRALDWLADNGLVEPEAAARARLHYPDPEPTNQDVPAAVAGDLATLYGERLRQVLLYGSWARGEGGVESDLDLLVVLSDLGSVWDELRRMDDVLWRHTQRSGITITALPVSQAEISRPTMPTVIRAKVEAVRIA